MNAKLDALGLVLDSDPRRVTKTGSAQTSDPATDPAADDRRRRETERPTNRTDPMDTMIELPAMRRSAELAPNTADADSPHHRGGLVDRGPGPPRQPSSASPIDEELSLDPAHVRLDRLNAGAPFLKVHELDTLDAVIGSVVPGSARIENGRGIALVRISERADVEPIWRDIQAGHIRAVSIGYQVHRFEVSKPEAARELWRAVDWTPFEVSAVAGRRRPRRRLPRPASPSRLRPSPPGRSSHTKGHPDDGQDPDPGERRRNARHQPADRAGRNRGHRHDRAEAAAPDPKVAASETRSQPQTPATPRPTPRRSPPAPARPSATASPPSTIWPAA